MERFNDLGFVRFDWREAENSEGKEIDIPVFTKNSNSRLTQQVINQINDVAEIPIFFDEDMEEFLTEDDNIQMAVNNSSNIFDEKFAKDNDDVVSLQQANIFLNNLAEQLESDKHLDDITVEVFNEILNKIQNGEIRIKGINPETLQRSRNKTLSILTILSQFGRERYRTSGRSGQMEKTINLVRKYFQEIDKWNENIEQTTRDIYGEPSKKSGVESLIFFSENEVIKLQSLSTAKLDLARAIERIFLQNEFDPTCQTEIIGVGQTQHGEFRLLLRQPHIKEAIEASTADIKADMKKRGYEYIGEGNYGPIYKNSKTEEFIEDARSVNVLKTKDNVLHYIDVIPSKERQAISTAKKRNDKTIPFARVNDREIYGLLDPKTGSIYLDSSKIKLEHPIHEYTHLWDRVVRKLNEDLWNRGVELMKSKALGLWNEVLNDESYGKNWVAKGIEGKKLYFLIASEVHSRCWQQVQLSSDNLIGINLPSREKDIFGECDFDDDLQRSCPYTASIFNRKTKSFYCTLFSIFIHHSGYQLSPRGTIHHSGRTSIFS